MTDHVCLAQEVLDAPDQDALFANHGPINNMTFRDTLLQFEKMKCNAALTKEDKESLIEFTKHLSLWIQPLCCFEMKVQEGRVMEIPIHSNVFANIREFNITPALIVAACAKLEESPHFAGVRLRYFERKEHWETTTGHLAGGQDLWGVKVTW